MTQQKQQKVTLQSLFSKRDQVLITSNSTTTTKHAARLPLKRSVAVRQGTDSKMMEKNLKTAEEIITKWDPDVPGYDGITSLWYHSRQEAADFLRSAMDLQNVMHYLAGRDRSSPKLVRAQKLMETAMRRLEKEFEVILNKNRQHLDAESVSNGRSSNSGKSEECYLDHDQERLSLEGRRNSVDDSHTASMMAMADLRSIAEAMISAGYSKECLSIYRRIRKTIVEEGLNKLGVERQSYSQIHKMDSQVMELKIKTWTHAVKVAVRTLFTGERILCDHVFASSETVRESCFSDVAKDAAILLFGFPEVVAKGRKDPESMFLILNLYDAIVEVWPEMESVFSSESTSSVRLKALHSLVKISETVRSMLSEFEALIQKESSKNAIAGGGVHPLTRYVTNFLVTLADYGEILADITTDHPVHVKQPLPDGVFESYDSDPLAFRFAWLILLLLCKIDSKADLYKDASLSYLFLANNLQYIVGKVQNSDLGTILGDDWIQKHDGKARQYASNHERFAWNKVTAVLSEIPTDMDVKAVKRVFGRFNSAFDEAYHAQTANVVADSKLKEEIKLSVARRIVPAYRSFYRRFRDFVNEEEGYSVVRFSPEDVENYLSDIFCGTDGNTNSSYRISVSNHSSVGSGQYSPARTSVSRH